MMKKIPLTICIAAVSACAFAQSVEYSVKAGLNWSTDQSSTAITGYSTGGRVGFHMGIVADIPMHQFSIMPGLYFITKGYVEHLTVVTYPNLQPTQATLNTHIRFNYLELPVNMLYHLKSVSGLNLYFGGGPYLGLGLNGKAHRTSSGGGATGEPDSGLSFGFSQSSNYKNPDYGFNFIIGQQIKHISIDLNYSLGLANILPSSEDRLKNRVAGISVGYLFK